MAKNLVIVESPAKSKTIGKYLGKDFLILASYGHVRDLVPRWGAVDPDHDYQMDYEPIKKNAKHVSAIAKALKKSQALYLATDPDREGEAISWHLCQLLEEQGVLKGKDVYRVVFHEITKRAVQQAIKNPRQLSQGLINAQLARRGVDYLAGFSLSPLLWKKIRRGLSAGRVQSPALRLIAEREEEIQAFEKKEYWTIEADLRQDEHSFVGKLAQYQGEKVKQFTFDNESTARAAEQSLKAAGGQALKVVDIEKKSRRRRPAPPFMTSTLQQEAVRKLGLTTQRVMSTAQSLYEGIGATGGLITYMRTDSVSLASEAINEIRDFIADQLGKDNVPSQPRFYKTKAKNAQEAHEAIRPTAITRTPDALRNILNQDQFRLYELIWKRSVACQMIDATLNTVAVNFACGQGNLFRATGSIVAVPGFMKVYWTDKESDQGDKLLPPMKPGQLVDLQKIQSQQHFTEPPPRYTEATLVRSLEEYGIGRPSTYANIISTLKNREYVNIERRCFYPTDVGLIVNRFLKRHFPDYVDYTFTARMEDDLDAVSRGEKEWIPLMDSFWKPFSTLIEEKEKSVSRDEATTETIDEQCPQCNSQLSIRLGRHGRFIGCSAYPDCNYTRNLETDNQPPNEPQVVEDRRCPSCDSPLLMRTGRYGKFIGCSAYPKCKFIESSQQPTTTEVSCPKCQQGELLMRRSRRGKVFYSCSRYPDCDYAVWNEPVAQPCPLCQWPMLTLKSTKRWGQQLVCPEKSCDYCQSQE